jgi:hypothetical protein
MSLTAVELLRAILDDRKAGASDESKIRKNAQNELALKWKAKHDAKTETAA